VCYLSGTPINAITKRLFGPPISLNEVGNLDQGFTDLRDTPGSVLLWQISSQVDQLQGFLDGLDNHKLTIISEITYGQQYYWIVSCLKNGLDTTYRCLWSDKKRTIYYVLASPGSLVGDNTTSWKYDKERHVVRIRVDKGNTLDCKSGDISLAQFPEPDQVGTWLPFPPTRLSDLHNAVGELKCKGLQVAGLHVGEMAQRPHSVVLDSVCKTLQGNEPLGYTPCRGYPELQNLIKQDLVHRKLITGKNLSIMCTNGARQALFQSLLYLIGSQKSDFEVIIPSPCWGAYREMTLTLGGNPIFTRLLPSGDLDLQDLKSKLTSKSRVLILCSPHNPTSTIISRDNLVELSVITKKYSNLVILSDEVYERLTFPNHNHCSPASIRDLYNQCLTISSLSKSHSMTGLRLGYLAGPDKLVRGIVKLQSCICTCPSSLSQYAAISALQRDTSYQETANILDKRAKLLQDIFTDRLVYVPKGGYYAWIDLNGLLTDNETDVSFCYKLLQRGVAVAAGSYFSVVDKSKQYLRISYGCSENDFHCAIPILRELTNLRS
jgi:aspartate/methionine/tyrosine aminotransferase